MPNESASGLALWTELRQEGLWVQGRVIEIVEGMAQEEIVWRPGEKAPSIGFHLWHLARWSDFDASRLAGEPQIWHARALRRAWGFPSALGENEAGTAMGDEASAKLVLPPKDELLTYARDSFRSLSGIYERVSRTDEDAERRNGPDATAVAAAIVASVTHDCRHLGMIEALRGLLGASGTATR